MSPQSINHLFFQACDEYDKTDAVLVKTDGVYKPISHKFFRQRVSQFGRGLLALGLVEGEHVAILAETRLEWTIADLGIVTAGGISVPIYPNLPAGQVAWILQNSHSIGIVVSNRDQAAKVASVQDQLPNLRYIVIMDELAEPPKSTRTMADVEFLGSKQDNEGEYEQRWKAKTGEDLFTIIYTSGTTGNPKGVMLTHANIISNIISCKPLMPYTPTDIHLAHLPLSHVFERMVGCYCMLYKGVTIAYAEDIKTVPRNIAEVRPTILISVPRLYEKIYAGILASGKSGSFAKKAVFGWALHTCRKALPYLVEDKPLPGFLAKKWALANKLVYVKIKARIGGRVRHLISGGAPLAKEIAELFLGMNLKMLEGYGLTETAPVLAFNRLEKIKPGTVGPAVDDVEIKIANDGEILARGPNVMLGYFDNPEATAEAIVDGWFHTGDIGVLDEDGYLHITDRKKDLLVTSGGKNIAPQPMENALKLSPLIEYAIVIGDRRNFISALLVPPWETVSDWATKNRWPTQPEILVKHPAFLKAMEVEVNTYMNGFAHYEQVKKFTVMPIPFSVEGDELTPSFKVKRKAVNSKYSKEIETMYTA